MFDDKNDFSERHTYTHTKLSNVVILLFCISKSVKRQYHL